MGHDPPLSRPPPHPLGCGAGGRAPLSRGRGTEAVTIVELGPADSAPGLKRYVTEVPITWLFFDARPDVSLEVFQAEAPRHPLFRIVRPAT
jgi:hypothetical protein